MFLTNSWLSLMVCAFALLIIAEARQMCYYCGFQANSGRECIDDPKNWRGGDPHNRCDFDCTINAIFNAVSGKPSFVYRACQSVDRADGCETIGATHTCFYSCRGKDYCNDRNLTRSPMLEDSDGGSSLMPRLSPVIVIWSLCTVILVRLITGRM